MVEMDFGVCCVFAFYIWDGYLNLDLNWLYHFKKISDGTLFSVDMGMLVYFVL